MTGRLGQAVGWARQVVLTAGAVLGVACILTTLGAAIFGLRPLVFESGSMSPTIHTGDLAISRTVDASSLESGQVVSVPTGTGSRVTHRIVAVTHVGSDAILRLRGDANTATDATHYRVSHADRVLFHLPKLGYAVGWLSGPMGLFVLGLYAAFLASVLLGRSPVPTAPAASQVRLTGQERVVAPSRPGGRRRGKLARSRRTMVSGGLCVVLLVGAVAGLAVRHQLTPTSASWTDASGVAGSSLGGYLVPAPDGSSCAVAAGGTNTSRGVDLTWPANVAPLPSLGYNTSVSTLTSPSKALTVSGATQKLSVTYDPGTNANKSKIVTVTATGYPTASPTWLGPTTSWKFKTGGNQSTNPTCGEAVPPAGSIVAPDATTRTRAAEQAFLASASGCTATGIILCGTMSDASTISVGYILQRNVGGTIRCWTGSWSTSCTTYQAASLNGQTQYYAGGTTGTVYNTAGAYTLTVQLTDSWDNTYSTSVSFTLT